MPIFSHTYDLRQFISRKIESKIVQLKRERRIDQIRGSRQIETKQNELKVQILRRNKTALIELALLNISTYEQAKLNENRIDSGLDIYLASLSATRRFAKTLPLSRWTRPCCSQFPGTWPFCNKSC